MNVDDLGIVLLLVAAVTAAGVAVDAAANKVSLDEKKYSLGNGALAWFFACVFLWVGLFPWYLIRRSRVLSRRRQQQEAEQNTGPARLVETAETAETAGPAGLAETPGRRR